MGEGGVGGPALRDALGEVGRTLGGGVGEGGLSDMLLTWGCGISSLSHSFRDFSLLSL